MADETEKLREDISELTQRIGELESMLRVMLKPLEDVRTTTNSYIRLASLILDHGGVTPDIILPRLKDHISRDIVRILLEHPDQNVSEISDHLRSRRGTASRRIVRNRLNDLEKEGIVRRQQKGRIHTYSLTPSVLKKWSQTIGLPIHDDL